MKTDIRILYKHSNGDIRIYKALDSKSYSEGKKKNGTALTFKVDKKYQENFKLDEQVCFFFDDYNFSRIDGCLAVGCIEGSTGCVPIFKDRSNAPGENYSLLLRTHAFSEAYRTYKGDTKWPMKIILVGVVVLVIGFLVFRGCGIGQGGQDIEGESTKIEGAK